MSEIPHNANINMSDIQFECQVADTNKTVFAVTQTVSGEDRILDAGPARLGRELILTRFASIVYLSTLRGLGGNTPVDAVFTLLDKTRNIGGVNSSYDPEELSQRIIMLIALSYSFHMMSLQSKRDLSEDISTRGA